MPHAVLGPWPIQCPTGRSMAWQSKKRRNLFPGRRIALEECFHQRPAKVLAKEFRDGFDLVVARLHVVATELVTPGLDHPDAIVLAIPLEIAPLLEREQAPPRELRVHPEVVEDVAQGEPVEPDHVGER